MGEKDKIICLIDEEKHRRKTSFSIRYFRAHSVGGFPYFRSQLLFVHDFTPM